MGKPKDRAISPVKYAEPNVTKATTGAMSKIDLLEVLYWERARCAERNNSSGWSLWAIVVAIISIAWMAIETWEHDSDIQPPMINWRHTLIIVYCIIVSAFFMKRMIVYNIISKRIFSPNNRIKDYDEMVRIDSALLLVLMIVVLSIAPNDFFNFTKDLNYTFTNINFPPISNVCGHSFTVNISYPFAILLLFCVGTGYFINDCNPIILNGYMLKKEDARLYYLDKGLLAAIMSYLPSLFPAALGIGVIFMYFHISEIKFGILVSSIPILSYALLWLNLNQNKIQLGQVDKLINELVCMPDDAQISTIQKEFEAIIAGQTALSRIEQRVKMIEDKAQIILSVSRLPWYKIHIVLYRRFEKKALAGEIKDLIERLDYNSENYPMLTSYKERLTVVNTTLSNNKKNKR